VRNKYILRRHCQISSLVPHLSSSHTLRSSQMWVTISASFFCHNPSAHRLVSSSVSPKASPFLFIFWRFLGIRAVVVNQTFRKNLVKINKIIIVGAFGREISSECSVWPSSSVSDSFSSFRFESAFRFSLSLSSPSSRQKEVRHCQYPP